MKKVFHFFGLNKWFGEFSTFSTAYTTTTKSQHSMINGGHVL